MKKIAILFSFLIAYTCPFAQTITPDESAPLGEIERGWVDLLQFKNGNTAFIFFSDNDDFSIKLYSPSHKLIIEKEIKPAFDKETIYSFAKSDFIIKNQIVLLFSAMKKMSFAKVSPALYRIILDGTTGSVIKEEELEVLTQLGAKGEIDFRKNRKGSPDFYVSKDPASDNYAIAILDTNEPDTNKKLKVRHYGSDNRIIQEGYFPLGPYSDVAYNDMVVTNDSVLYVCAKVEYGGFTSIGCFRKGTSKVIQKTFLDKVSLKSRLYYNAENKSLILFGATYLGTESNTKFMGPYKQTAYYAANISILSSRTLDIDFETTVAGPSFKKDYGNTYIPSGPFSGVPYAFYINDDKTYTILYQELNVQKLFSGSRETGVNTFLGSVGVSVLNDRFQELNSYLIPCGYYLQGEEYGLMASYNDNANQPKHLRFENQYKLCSYINHKDKKIILFNDDPKNIEDVKTGKIKLISSLGGASGYNITIDQGKMSRDLVFQKLDKSFSFGMFIAHCYDPSTETFVTIRRSNRKGWQNQLVWMKL